MSINPTRFAGAVVLAALGFLARPSFAQSLTGNVSPRQVSTVGTLTYSASASGLDPWTTQYAFFRRRPGGTWIPDINAPNWQSSSTYNWNPTSSDVGTWETYIWAKDAYTPWNANTYGYAAGFNTMPIDVIGPPTQPGPTTVSCDYTVSDECWVTGDFTVSVSPSSGGIGSLNYEICRSNDTLGWGGCDVSLTLYGGTSFTVSGWSLPSDGYRRAYYFLARDSAGALSPWNSPRFVKVDRYAPSVSATNASDLWFSYRTLTIFASDSGSGVQSVRYNWNAPLDGGCWYSGNSGWSGMSLEVPNGDNYLYVCARDNTGRVGQWSGHYRVAPLSLTGSISPSSGSYAGTFTYTASASGGTPSTIRYAFFRRRPGGTWIPDVNNPNWQASNVFTWTPAQADVGTWETYLWVKDGDTPWGMNTYTYAAGFNTMPITVVGPPTVPGATSVSCAYYVAATADCWVQGDFTASVAASTGGTGGIVYQICRSNDTTGWGGCDLNLTLSGGTSILVSGTHLASDGYRRAYYFQAKDSAGALSGWNSPAYVRVDRYAPAVSASNASTNWFSSQTATVSASDVAGGAGANSGLAQVRYAWNSALDAACTTGTAVSSGTTLTAPVGDNLLYLCAKDNVGRVAQWNGSYRVAAPPSVTGTVSPAQGSYLGSFTYTASASGGVPGTIQYAFFRRPPGGTWIPSVTAPTWQASNVFTWNPTIANVGTWETYIWVKDANTPATMNTYGYAAGANTGVITVVGPPTVPGPTTVVCAYAVADDCWVQGDFTVSVTASTGGMGSLVYQICRSNDSPGGFAGCEANLTLSGGTSLLISGTNLASDGYRRAYYFQAKDTAGALSGWNTPRYVRVDRYAPVVSATNASNLWFSSRTATLSASDVGSGLAAVRYSWNAALDAGCTTGTATSNGTVLTAPAGDNVLYLCGRDSTGRVGTWSGQYRIAPMTLTATVSPSRGSYLGSFTYTASAGGGTPATTRFAFFRRPPGGIWIPDVNSPNWQASNTFTWTPALADVGTWETYVWVKDGDTPAGANTYGYAAGFNTGSIEVVGRPTVPGPTTVGCAYAVADDCWVTGDFTASVTASTGGMGSLVYQICRSNDSPGGFAGCEVNLTLSGGTSLVISGADLPSAGSRRAYYFQAKDSAGALSGWNAPRYVRVDRLAPDVSGSNPSLLWTTNRNVTVAASDATSDSGLAAVRTSWNTPLDAGCTTGTATSAGATLTAPFGDNLLYLCARDNVSRVTQWSGRYRVSNSLTLIGSVSPTRASYPASYTYTAVASGGTPATTQYAFFHRRPGGEWIPPVTAPAWQASPTFAWTPGLEDVGTWETYIWVKDGTTAPDANGFGFAAGFNPGPVELFPPLTLTATPSPAQAPYGSSITWTATATGGVPESTQYAFFRRPAGADWIPPVTAPQWQSSNSYSWTPAAADLGVWETYVWVKDGSTAAGAHTYGYAAGTNPGPVEIVVPPGFTLDVTPAAATVMQGRQAQFTISLDPEPGFTGTADLMVTGIPAAASHSLVPAEIGAGNSATLTVSTTGDTPQGDHSLTVTAAGTYVTHIATVQLSVTSAHKPVLDSISPDSFTNGGRVRVTVQGLFLFGATVSIAREQTDPDLPVSRVLPTAQLISIDPSGTSMVVEIDATDTRILDFHNLVVDNGVDVAAIPFRVLPGGPLPDAWTPSEPQVGLIHALSIAGRNLAGTTLTPSVAGRVLLHSVETTDTEITALLEVLPNAPTGPLSLIISDGVGRTAEIRITIVPPNKSRLTMHNLTASRDGEKIADGYSRVPAIWFQEFVVRDPYHTEVLAKGLGLRVHPLTAEALAERRHKSISFELYIQITIPLVRLQWQKVILFDPITGAIGDAVLQALGVGAHVPIGAFVISAYFQMDLTIYFRLTNLGYTFPLFCIEISYGIEVTGFDGFAYHTSFCRGGGWHAFGTGSVSDGEITGGDCASVTPTSFTNGVVKADVQQNACCSQPIRVAMRGHTFTGLTWQRSFSLDNPQAGTTTPDPNACACPCTVRLQGTALTPGGLKTGDIELRNTSSEACTYQFDVTQISGQTQMDLANARGTLTVEPNQTVHQAFTVSFPNGRPARDVANLEVAILHADSEGNLQLSCRGTNASCVYPSGEMSSFLGWWSVEPSDTARFMGEVTPTSTDFAGRSVTEGGPNAGAGSYDNCYFSGSPFPNYANNNLSGGNWNIVGGNDYNEADLIGMKCVSSQLCDLDKYYKSKNKTPCTMGTNQRMQMSCGPVQGGTGYILYKQNVIRFNVGDTGTTITRGNATSPVH